MYKDVLFSSEACLLQNLQPWAIMYISDGECRRCRHHYSAQHVGFLASDYLGGEGNIAIKHGIFSILICQISSRSVNEFP